MSSKYRTNIRSITRTPQGSHGRDKSRVLLYYRTENNEIHFVLTKVHGYGDWTVFGGSCNEGESLVQCGRRETSEESHDCVAPAYFDVIYDKFNISYDFMNYQTHKKEHMIITEIFQEKAIDIINCFNESMKTENYNRLPHDQQETYEITDMTMENFWNNAIDGLFNIFDNENGGNIDSVIDPSISLGLLIYLIKSIKKLDSGDYCYPVVQPDMELYQKLGIDTNSIFELERDDVVFDDCLTLLNCKLLTKQ